MQLDFFREDNGYVGNDDWSVQVATKPELGRMWDRKRGKMGGRNMKPEITVSSTRNLHMAPTTASVRMSAVNRVMRGRIFMGRRRRQVWGSSLPVGERFHHEFHPCDSSCDGEPCENDGSRIQRERS